MSWYNTNESSNTHILWSRVRYSRDLAALPFKRDVGTQSRDTSERYAKTDSELNELMINNGFHEEILPTGLCAEACALAEKQFVSFAFVQADRSRAVYFNEPCSLTIFTGGESYMTVQALLAGSSLVEARKIASEAEEMLDREFEFAYSDKLGYLSSDISKCGSGVEFSVSLFLPSLRHGTRLQEFRCDAEAFGASFSPFMSKYENAGDIYIVSYRPSFLSDEEFTVRSFASFIESLVENEKKSERIIFANKSTLIVDRAWRAFGALAYAKSLDEDEMLSLLSRIRISLCLEQTKNYAPPCDLQSLNLLLAEGLNNSVISGASGGCANSEECKTVRAKYVNSCMLSLCNIVSN